jgi:hypothetical protein
MLLSSRYKYDGLPKIALNDLQKSFISKMQAKIQAGIYQFETVACPICSGTAMEPVAEKDRYGFQLSMVVCTACGLAQTNPRMNQEAYNQFYDQEYRYVYGGEASPSEVFFKDQYNRLGKKIYDFITKESSWSWKWDAEPGGYSSILKIGVVWLKE